MSFIMVLNDGETYTDLHGCIILDISALSEEEVEDSNFKRAVAVRRFGPEPRPYDYLHDSDVFRIARLEKIKEHLMAVDGWSQTDIDTINEVIARLQ